MFGWFKQLFASQRHSTGRAAASSTVTRGKATGPLTGPLTETIVNHLQLAQKYTLNCPSLHPAFFRLELRHIIDGYQALSSPEAEASLRETSVKLIAAQRDREQEHLTEKENELKAIIELIVTEIDDAHKDSQAFTAEMTRNLKDIDTAVEPDDLRQIRERIAAAVAKLTHNVELRQNRDAQRVRNLEDQVGILESRIKIAGGDNQTDGLTALYNRHAFDDRIRAEVSLTRRLATPLCLVLVDIDQFALVNQTQGENIGDEVLTALSHRLIKEFFRQTDFIARYDGEEFAVLLSQAPLEVAAKAAERLRESLVSTPIRTAAGEVVITISAGVAQCTATEHHEELIARASSALQSAKEQGCNRVVVSGGAADQHAA